MSLRVLETRQEWHSPPRPTMLPQSPPPKDRSAEPKRNSKANSLDPYVWHAHQTLVVQRHPSLVCFQKMDHPKNQQREEVRFTQKTAKRCFEARQDKQFQVFRPTETAPGYDQPNKRPGRAGKGRANCGAGVGGPRAPPKAAAGCGGL